MLGELLKTKRTFLILVVISLLQSCGTNSYDTPLTTATSTVISAKTVNGYVAAGQVNGTRSTGWLFWTSFQPQNYAVNRHIPVRFS